MYDAAIANASVSRVMRRTYAFHKENYFNHIIEIIAKGANC